MQHVVFGYLHCKSSGITLLTFGTILLLVMRLRLKFIYSVGHNHTQWSKEQNWQFSLCYNKESNMLGTSTLIYFRPLQLFSPSSATSPQRLRVKTWRFEHSDKVERLQAGKSSSVSVVTYMHLLINKAHILNIHCITSYYGNFKMKRKKLYNLLMLYKMWATNVNIFI